uniref:Gnk2-homologous domain-containing protein n=1 Tax=Triticum urartu TaxID=4572 RepID=A0A8R7QYA9_TRIUA
MRYATGRMDVNSTFPLLYSQAQCNLDLPPGDCWECLYHIQSTTKSFLNQQLGEWIAGMWCNLRYSPRPFYEGQPMKQVTWSDPTTNMMIPQRHVIKVLIITTVVLPLASFFCFMIWFRLIKRHVTGVHKL